MNKIKVDKSVNELIFNCNTIIFISFCCECNVVWSLMAIKSKPFW